MVEMIERFLPLISAVFAIIVMVRTIVIGANFKRRNRVMHEQMLDLYSPLYVLFMQDIKAIQKQKPLDDNSLTTKCAAAKDIVFKQIHLAPPEIFNELLFTDTLSEIEYSKLCIAVDDELNKCRKTLGYPHFTDPKLLIIQHEIRYVFFISLTTLGIIAMILAFTMPDKIFSIEAVGVISWAMLAAIILDPILIFAIRQKRSRKEES